MTAANFETALRFTLSEEGGWSDAADDPGGATLRGVTLHTYRWWKHDFMLGPDDLRKMTDAECAAIYHTMYWSAVHGDTLPSGEDLTVFDMAVNAGPKRSIELLQAAVGAEADGLIGQETLTAISKAHPTQVVAALAGLQRRYYEGLATFDEFGEGWLARTERRVIAAMKLTGTT